MVSKGLKIDLTGGPRISQPNLMGTHCALGPGLAAYRAWRSRWAHSRLMIILSCYSDDDYDDDYDDGRGDSPPSLLPIPTSSLLSLGVSPLLDGPSPSGSVMQEGLLSFSLA